MLWTDMFSTVIMDMEFNSEAREIKFAHNDITQLGLC